MKKLNYLFLLLPLLLVACFHPPTPSVEEAIQNADPNTIVPLRNEITDSYFRTALPVVHSPARGLIFDHIHNRADIEQVEMSLLRLATDYFDPELHFFRQGQHLTRDFVSQLLRHQNPEPIYDAESRIGLNPEIGATIAFEGQTFENSTDNLIRPLAYIVEQNFVTITDDNQFELEGIAIAIALNPFYLEVDTTIGFEHMHEMSEEAILEFGKEIAANLLPLLREHDEVDGLEEVPILIGLYILRSNRAILPGHFASLTYLEEGRSLIREWTNVYERHFSLPDRTNSIHVHDVDINDQFNTLKDTINNYFPHSNGIIGRAHFVNNNVYRISITFNMHFLGAAERLAFFQLLEEHVTNFSQEYNVNIVVRNFETILGTVNRPPNGEVMVQLVDW